MKYLELEELCKEWNGKVCLFGAGVIGKTWGYDVLLAAGFRVTYYFDSKLDAHIEVRDGVKTIDFATLCTEKEDVLVFIAVSEKYHNEIIQKLGDNGIVNYYALGFEFLQEFCDSVLASTDNKIIEKYKCVVDDEEYLRKQFKYKLGYELNFENPRTFNEKLQWLKVHDRNPEYTRLVDKYEFKEYIRTEIGEEYVIPTIGVWNSVDDIDLDELPKQFVLKCTHDSSSIVFCKDKDSFDINSTKKKLKTAMQRNYYWMSREWPYKNIKPRIIAEPYLQNKEDENSLVVYKILNFGQDPKLVQVIQNDKQDSETVDYYDINWNLLDLRQNYPNSNNPLNCPAVFGEMLDVAKKLVNKVPSVRTDFYVVKNKLYISEITFYSDAGMERFYPDKWDSILGEWLSIPRK